MKQSEQDGPPGLQTAVRGWVEKPRIQNVIMALIVINAVILGLETVPAAMQRFGDTLIAIDDPERILELVGTARKHFPHLTILSRAIGRTHAYELLEAGLDTVYRETLDS